MAKQTVQMRLEKDLVARLDEAAGPGKRTAFVVAAVEAALAERARVVALETAVVPRPDSNSKPRGTIHRGRDVVPVFKAERDVEPRFKR